MPALQIKDCPDDVYRGLKECAARENRNISQQMLSIIERYLDGGFDPRPAASAGTVAYPTASVSLYAERRVEGGGYVEKRQQAFRRIAELPAVKPAGDGVTVADLVRKSREEAR